MKSRIAVLSLVTVLAWAQAPSVEGTWEGTLDVQGAKLRLLLKVKKAADGGLTSTIDSLDQGTMDIPVASSTWKDGVLALDVQAVRGSFEGKPNESATEIAGQWTQGGRSLPLNFRRSQGIATPVVKGRPLNGAERDYLINHLERTRKLFLDSIASVTDAQWSFKAGADRWSINECAEHITVSEDFLFQIATQRILKIPPLPDRPEGNREADEKVFRTLTDRSQKAQAPEPVKPTGRFADRPALIAEFSKRRDRSVEYVKTTQDDLRNHATPHPALGPLDAYQFLVLLAGHSQRHTAQIEEVKTSTGYPK